MTKNSFNSGGINDWSLPEFGLMNQVHNTTQKKLKINTELKKDMIQKKEFEQEYQKGFEKGYAEGLQKSNNEISKKINALSLLIKEMEQSKQNCILQTQMQGIEILKVVSEKILQVQLAQSDEILLKIIQKAIEVVDSNTDNIKIHGHSSLIALFNSHKEMFDDHIIFEVDSNINEYSFKIESDKQYLQFDLRQAVSKIFDEFKHQMIK